jgi:thiol-disulfide isomerase/thioredoxin
VSSRPLLTLGALIVALLCAWAGFRFYVSRQSVPSVESVPAGQASPPSLTDLATDVPVPAKIPEKLPAFALKDLKGKATPIDTWSGKALVINFWATWCGPCRREIPLLKALSGEWASRGVTMVGIAVDYPDKVEDFAGQFHISYPLLVGEQEALDVAAQLGVASPVFPFTVFTDRRGEVVVLIVGEIHRPQAELILQEIESIDKNGTPLLEGRRKISEGLATLADKAPLGST